ncbi:fibronectin type III domain-containing protein [Streptomyces sp. NPDC048191]|uniref:fibronectin type III domain-containing protein n=1 Tax=Streptomyces sp. NPDC048191 TaxID=3155484 RepID=UPI0033C9BCF5
MRLRNLTTSAVTTAAATALLGAASLAPAAGSTATDRHTLTATPLTTWQTDGIVWSVAYARGIVYVGGAFDNVRPPGANPGEREVARKDFAAFDAVTGALLPCAHSFTGAEDSVRVLKPSPDGSALYIGGSFGSVDRTDVASAVALRTADCSLRKDFRPAVSATVRAIDTTDRAVYLGGDFTAVDGRTRKHIAALTPTGSLLPFAADIDKPVRAVLAAPDHGKILVGGDFNEVNGDDQHALVALHPTTGATVSSYPQWLPKRSVVMSLARDGGTFYLGAEGRGGGVFDGRVAGRLSDDRMLWKDTCLGATQVVLPYNGLLYSGSHAHDCHKTPGGFPDSNKRWPLLAQSTTDKTLQHWFPDTNGGLGEGVGPRTMVMADGILWVGGEFTQVNDKPQQGLTRFGTASGPGPEEVPTLSVSASRTGRVTLGWDATWDRDDAVLTYTLYRDGVRLASLRQRSAPWDRPRMTYTDMVPAGSSHWYRIAVSDGTHTVPRSVPGTPFAQDSSR